MKLLSSPAWKCFLWSCICSSCTTGEYLQSGIPVGRSWAHHWFVAWLAYTVCFLQCQWTASCRCKLVLNFPINCLVPHPPLHLAQQALPVHQGPRAQTPGFDRPAVRCAGRAVLGLKGVPRSRLGALAVLCPGKIALSLSAWHELVHHFVCQSWWGLCIW